MSVVSKSLLFFTRCGEPLIIFRVGKFLRGNVEFFSFDKSVVLNPGEPNSLLQSSNELVLCV